MTFRAYLVLFILALVPPIIIAQFQPAPGYLDSDYYYAGGIQLVEGRGFNEPYMWNYLDGSTSLPHPSHAYWQPLASIVAAFGMWLTGQTTYASARLFFILIAGLVPPVTMYLAYQYTQKRELAITSGLLAIFSVYSAPFMGVTDNFGIFMLLGGLYFILVWQLIQNPSLTRNWLLLGLLAGLMTLSRSDGLLWLAVTFLFALWRVPKKPLGKTIQSLTLNAAIALLGFLMIMAPWYLRNLNVYGSIMAPGGSRALWLENYDQTFIYPPDLLSKESFLASGWQAIAIVRLKALGQNFQSAFAAHGAIILFPFILAGFYAHRHHEMVKLAGIAWLILFSVMTFVFPFAGARGAFFHAGAAFQPIWWMLAPLGLEAVLAALRKRNWGDDQARVVFRSAMVMIVMILTVFVVYLRLFGEGLGWSEGEENYRPVEKFLQENGIEQDDIVIVRNAPGYYLETGRSALPIPYGNEQAVLAVADQFGAYYLVLETKAVLKPMKNLYDNPNGNINFVFLGELDDTKLYRIELK
jgi:hypothetical protein